MNDWNSKKYLQFEKERTQPVKDLISRIELTNPSKIIDIGCGPGNSTNELQKKWKNADIIGLDNSPNMIEKANKSMANIKWILQDANTELEDLGKFDIVFSNAAIQWMPNHEKLIPKLFNMVEDKGVLAVQLPNTSNMPVHIALKSISSNDKWSQYFDGSTSQQSRHNIPFYYDVISSLTSELYIWEVNYFHVMENHHKIIEWYESTGMKPYLERLHTEELQAEFKHDMLVEISKHYPTQKNGRILFKFKREFFLAYK